jgi:hypothetical protein
MVRSGLFCHLDDEAITNEIMTGAIRYDRLVLLMDADELEKFCRDWVEKKSGYLEVRRFAGSGDKGRDVVGFRTDVRHDGAWDNYQCKQYLRGITLPQALLAIGKVLYWASQGEFTPPDNFYFVAPKGLANKLESIIDKPSELKAALLNNWDSVCASSITKKQTISLDAKLMAFIDAFAFKNVRIVTLDDLMADPAVKSLLIEKWGADPGKYPPATVPIDVQSAEMRYIDELVGAYGERAKAKFSNHDAVLKHEEHGPDLRRQRERYFEADAFQKFYRDNTSAIVIGGFRKDIQHGVAERWNAPSTDTLARVEAVMDRAGTILPAGPLAKYAHVPVKQGMCHHFVNDGELSWKKKP